MELDPKAVEERFNRILTANLNGAQGSRWMIMIIIVAIVAAVVFSSYYYVTKKKGQKNDKKGETKTITSPSTQKPGSTGTSGSKLVISSEQ